MTKLLLRLFVKDYENVKNPLIREKYGILSGIVGIIVNVLLTVGKFIIGTASNSISITADAINNLSDAGSCTVTLFGFKIANRKPDKEHPFGHGRIEYVAALIVGFIVELMSIELIKSSAQKIISPQEIVFSIPAVCVLVFSILGKLWLAVFNRNLGKKIASPVLSASVKDSISDITATSFTLFSLILAKFANINIDGYLGIIVALFIMYSGFTILKESIGIIIGTPPSGELVDELVLFIKSYPGVLGMHDLVIHSYGESRVFGSVHVEISEKTSLVAAHKIVDKIENEVKQKFNLSLVAHIDPVSTDNKNYEHLKIQIADIISEIDETFSVHDLRIVSGSPKKAVFDLVVPFNCQMSQKEIKALINEKAKKQNIEYILAATIECSYT